MTMHTTQTGTTRLHPAIGILFGLFVFAMLSWNGVRLLHYYETENDPEVESWLRDVLKQKDPWKRYTTLDAGFAGHHSSVDQRRRMVEHMGHAIEQALAARTVAAFDLVETQGVYVDLLDKYPRDPARRQLQLEALWLLWPDIVSRTPAVRMQLVRMANRCHLHEAAPPLTRQTVVDCLRYGARSLGTQQDLTKLMDSAVLGEALAGAAP